MNAVLFSVESICYGRNFPLNQPVRTARKKSSFLPLCLCQSPYPGVKIPELLQRLLLGSIGMTMEFTVVWVFLSTNPSPQCRSQNWLAIIHFIQLIDYPSYTSFDWSTIQANRGAAFSAAIFGEPDLPTLEVRSMSLKLLPAQSEDAPTC